MAASTAVAGRNSYTLEEIERGLLELALTGNRPLVAAQRLGEPYCESTLRYWRDTKPERYQEIQDTVAPRVEEDIVRQARDTIVLAAEVERQAIQATGQQLAAGQLKDASTAARNLATVKGIGIDKLMLMTDRPTQRIEQHGAAELLRALAIDSTAEEIPDADVVD